MFSLVYVSSATELLSEKELSKILETSRRNNEKLEVTGMLLYKDGNFMQFLEGARKDVCGLVDKIRKDPRHRGLIMLLQQEHLEREFPDWAMGFERLDSGEMPRVVPGYGDFPDLPLTSEEFLIHPTKCLSLLLNFKKNLG